MKGKSKFMRLTFYGNNFEKLKAIAEKRELSLHVYVSEILNNYLKPKHFPRGYKKETK